MSILSLSDYDRDLPVSSSLRLYPVLQDSDTREVFLNVFRSYVVDDDVYNNEIMFDYYMVQNDDWLDDISYRFYSTPFLWWVVALFNGITNPYEELEEGNVLRILKYNNIYTIFDDISKIEGL